MDIANEDNNSTDADYVPDEEDADDSDPDVATKSKVSLSHNLNGDDEPKDSSKVGDSDDDDDEPPGDRDRWKNDGENGRRSKIWNYFVDVNDEARTATCRICFNEYSFYTTIGNLSSHLKRMHKINLPTGKHWTETLKEADADSDADNSEADVATKSKVSLSHNLNGDDEPKDSSKVGDSDDDDDEPPGDRNRWKNDGEKGRRSKIWNYFVDVNDEARTATCRICFNEYSFFTTIVNLSSHLKRVHKINLHTEKHWTETLKEAEADSHNGSHKRSEIWNYFKALNSTSGKSARCCLCDKVFSYLTTTGNLNSHLKRKHGIVLGKNVESENDASEGDKQSTEKKNRRLDEFWKRFTVTDEVKKLAKCNICGQELGFCSPNNLKKHLFRAHGHGRRNKDDNDRKRLSRGRMSSDVKEYTKKSNTIWNVFDDNTEKIRTATCKVCKKDISYLTSITNLKRHIHVMHNWVSLDQPYMEEEEGEAEIAEEQTSPVWAYFKCLSKDLKLASCLICKKRIDYNDEQDLNSHLGRKHPRVLSELESNTKPKKLMITGDGDIYEIDDDVAKQEPETEKEQHTDDEDWQHNEDETDALENFEYLDESIFNEPKPSPAKKIRFTPDRKQKIIQPVKKTILFDNRKSTQENEEGPIDLFSKYMTSLLKQLPKHKSDKLQADFIRLIMDAQMDECQNTSSVNNSYINTRSSSHVINIRSPKSNDDAITSNSDVQRVITSDGQIRQLVVGNEVIVSSAAK